MKKLITLLLLFTITLFYSIPTQAFTLNGNDIPLVQTKNLFDKSVNAYEQGTINISGNNSSSVTRARTIGFIEINSSTQYIFSMDSQFRARSVFEYDISFIYLGEIFIDGSSFTTSSTTKYIRFIARSEAPLQDATITSASLTTINNSSQLELGATATSYANYGFLTLNDIFLDGNLRSSFTNERTDIVTYTGTSGNWTLSVGGFNIWKSTFSVSLNDKAYLRTSNEGANFDFVLRNSAGTATYFTKTYTDEDFNFIATFTSATSTFDLRHASSAVGTKIFDFTMYLDLNDLGIDHLTIGQIDRLYNTWENTNSYIEGFTDGFNDGYTDGFNDGYDEGFDDGVASETSFAVGYALGLSQGADMETGSSLLILIVALIGFILMIIGFITKRGIFNLLSTGAFIVLGGLLVEFVGFIIIAIGLVLINIYYAFFGNV